VVVDQNVKSLAADFLRVLALDKEALTRYLAVFHGKLAFEYPDDDLPRWDDETIASRALALAAFRTLHYYSYSEPTTAWQEELRGILTVIESMIACDAQEYFWCLDKDY
jgi:hypothetical protein